MTFNTFKKVGTKLYIQFIALVVVLTLINQLIIQYVLHQRAYESRIISLAGKQRMLSQKIVKLACQNHYEEVLPLLEEWNDIHIGLQQGCSVLGVPKLENQYIKAMFDEVNPVQTKIYWAVKRSPVPKETSENRFVLRNMDSAFMHSMDKIIWALEEDSKKKQQSLIFLEIALATISLIIIFAVVFFVIRPAIQTITEQNRALGQIAFTQSHHVRRHLVNIMGTVSLIKEEKISLTQEQKQLFELLEEASNNLDDTIHEVVKKVNALQNQSNAKNHD
ncbi:MAG: type IV pili methyl-accepting chemotaxis transducer N-terminal domain-containing protein [Raineya sp.]|jgi:hypothetical protein|nr:type IV pili methyl-accepting chemotaxis transducer N-terminal domain-containing protein [Raineya sp.]